MPNYVRTKFSEYYQRRSLNIQPPSSLKEREFGFLLFDGKAMLRHKGFKSAADLEFSLNTIVPSDAFYSCAYYQSPDADMDKKGWLGADLVFDIDADHIPTPCGKVHDAWVCSHCGFAGKGPSPDECPACRESKFEDKTWTCDACLDAAKQETTKLLNMLKEDFGFTNHELSVYFSGNRGYHVHVENLGIRMLDSMARKEIVDYVVGLGLKAEFHELIAGGKLMLAREATGWKARIASGIRKLLAEAESTPIEQLGLSQRSTSFLVANSEKLRENLEAEQWLSVKGVGVKNWKKIIQWIVDRQSAKIDTVVTTDIHRLIRLAGSLHGKTGFMKTQVPSNSFSEFDPLKESIAFKEGQAVVDITETPEFRIGDTVYGPFKNASHVELPTAAAVFLLCKGAAQMVE